MRPVQRGSSPQATDFIDYTDAKPDLVSRLGPYCSYCERKVVTNLAVEHIQPKGLPAYAALEGRWDNFLLGCVNCNSTKKHKNLVLADILLPDRDNTFSAIDYFADGRIEASALVPLVKRNMVLQLLSLVGLDKPISAFLDENGKQVALDRVAQRMLVWGIAQEAKNEVDGNVGNESVRRLVVKLAQAEGFFSIWMTVFSGDNDMCKRLVNAFPGTQGSGCFDSATANLVCPAPNPDQLPHGAKM